jgi:hypothetical protein
MHIWMTAVGVGLFVGLAGGGIHAGQRGAGPGQMGAPAGTPAAPIGIIVGRVVDAAGGQPVSDAQVTVMMRAAQAPPAGRAGAPGGGRLRLFTGADGRFVVRDLPAGNVQISVQAPGYLNGNYGQTAPGIAAGRPVVISAENRVVEAVVRLWKHAVVTGIVTDEANEPAINITVQALRRSFASGRPRYGLGGTGRTDDRGVYRIAALAPGDYVVAVPQTQMTMPAAVLDAAMNSLMGGELLSASVMGAAAAGMGSGGGVGLRVGDSLISSSSGALPVVSGDGRMAAYVTQFYPSAGTIGDATVVALGSGEIRNGIDIRMPLLPTVKISGTVNGPDGPLPNLQVRLLPAGAALTADAVSEVARGTTAADGSFVLLGVPVGSYVAKVLKTPPPPMPAAIANNPQLQAMMGGRFGGPATPSDALTLFANVPVSAERAVEGLVITLSTGATVSGRVDFVGSAAVPPTTGLTVALQSIVGTPLALRPARVGDDGSFVTAGYPAGQYFLNPVGRLPGWFIKSAMVNGVDALDQPFELSAENIGNVVITAVDRQTGVSGTVTGGTGAGVEGTVIVFPAAYREWITRGMPQRVLRNVRAQASGAFSMMGLPARDYLIVALTDADIPDLQNPAVYDALARAATSVTLIEGDTRSVSLKLAQVVR